MKWQIAEPISKEFRNKFPEIDPVVLQLLWNRGIKTQEQIDEFLYPDYSQDIHDPFLFLDMEKAVERIFQAVDSKEKIMVHGDYDADGVCSALIMVSALEALGANVGVYLPHRELEGYGLNMQTVEEFGKNGVNLIVTTDCGISNREEIKRACELGMDVIITDHHAEPPNLPEAATAIIDPYLAREKYPFRELSGAGVAFKVVQAILKNPKSEIRNPKFGIDNKEAFEKWLLDLVAIATIADIMPILGENRTFVKYGLLVLNKTRRVGLKKLIESLALNKTRVLDAKNVAFQIGPRLNSAGRINHANQAYALLQTNDETRADELVADLSKTNEERQALSDRIMAEAKNQIGKDNQENFLFALGKDWPLGVVGLIAGKIADEFWRPAIVMTEKEGTIVGSGRSIPEFDIIAALREVKEFLSRYGGHAGACGFTVRDKNDLEKFRGALRKVADREFAGKEIAPAVLIDAEVRLEKINWELFELLEKFSPFGKGNERPRYLGRGLVVENFLSVGANGNHLRLMLSQGNGEKKKFIGFCFGEWCQKLKAGDCIDVVFEVDVNEWNGNRELQMKIVDLKLSDTNDANSDANDANYVRGAYSEQTDKIIYPQLSFELNGVLFEVHNKLGRHCNEKQYCDAIQQLLEKKKIQYEREKILPPSFDGERFGRNKIDFLIEGVIVLEVKAKRFIGKEEYYQCLRYSEAFDKKLALVVNFREKHLNIKRILNPKAKV
jgi:single-stranded-DNA-specific exonuclease